MHGNSHDLKKSLNEAREFTDKLFELVNPDALYDRPIPERNRIAFYIGHLETFDWNLLIMRQGGHSFNPEFDKLFAFGIDPIDGKLPTDHASDWPKIELIRDYCSRVRESIDAQFEHMNEWDLNIAIEHRLMHAETLAYILHRLPLSAKFKKRSIVEESNGVHFDESILIPRGATAMGQWRDGTFGWDNEFPRVLEEVPEFYISKHNVTNRDFLNFVNAHGYHDPSLWTIKDWEWLKKNDIKHPNFWEMSGLGVWRYQTMFEEIPLPLSWPVYVSHAEASAYARFMGKSLPTEAQWHRASEGLESFDMTLRWNPRPVGRSGMSKFGVADLNANGWEWTKSEFKGFEGFEPYEPYEGYSKNFFDGNHYVLKGASGLTHHKLNRKSFRNWFQPHYQNVYSTFRLVG